jgi:hypothetical protein
MTFRSPEEAFKYFGTRTDKDKYNFEVGPCASCGRRDLAVVTAPLIELSLMQELR